jgi:phosphoglycolate phosphatase
MRNRASPIHVDAMLFDLDGTLIDSKADLARSINLMLKDLSRPSLSEDAVGGFVGDGVRVLVRRSLTATHPGRQAPEPDLHERGIELMHKHYADQMLVTTQLFPHVEETLRYFREKKKALVTSKEVRFARIILDHFGIGDCFDAVVGGDMVPQRKPDPAPVIEGIRLLGSAADKSVMIGDSENDIVAGQRAGALTCAVTFGFRTAEHMRKTEPDVLINRFDQLKERFA